MTSEGSRCGLPLIFPLCLLIPQSFSAAAAQTTSKTERKDEPPSSIKKTRKRWRREQREKKSREQRSSAGLAAPAEAARPTPRPWRTAALPTGPWRSLLIPAPTRASARCQRRGENIRQSSGAAWRNPIIPSTTSADISRGGASPEAANHLLR